MLPEHTLDETQTERHTETETETERLCARFLLVVVCYTILCMRGKHTELTDVLHAPLQLILNEPVVVWIGTKPGGDLRRPRSSSSQPTDERTLVREDTFMGFAGANDRPAGTLARGSPLRRRCEGAASRMPRSQPPRHASQRACPRAPASVQCARPGR